MNDATMIISDCHGYDPTGLIKNFLGGSSKRKVRLLGDYDNPKLVRKLTDLRRAYLDRDGNQRIGILYGNHDYHLVEDRGGGIIRSSTLTEQAAYQFQKEWANEPKESKDIFKTHAISDYDNDRQICYVHAGIDGRCEGNLEPHIWTRMCVNNGGKLSPHGENIRQNLIEMDTSNFDIMFRGHDHLPFAISAKKEASRLDETLTMYSRPTKLKIEPDKKYIICTGAFCLDRYAIWNPEKSEIIFRSRTLMDKLLLR